MDYAKMILDKKPIVQCITNIVTVNDCANALLAIGASPTMAHLLEEVEEIQSGCDALVCNLGATENFDAMLVAAKKADELGHPIVIDPVGCGGSSVRREFFCKLIEACRPACIRGNYSEIAALAHGDKTVTGVDSGTNVNNIEADAVNLAKRTKGIVVASGIEDVVTDGEIIVKVTGGDVLMSRITGTGCMESSLLGAYLVVEESMDSVVSCCKKVKDAGQIAADSVRERRAGTMTFKEKFIDNMFVQ